MSDDFETTVTFNEKEIELLGHIFVARFQEMHRQNLIPEGVTVEESALLQKILRLRTEQIIAARAEGKL